MQYSEVQGLPMRLLLVPVGFVLGLAGGCEDPKTNAEACFEIIEACHVKDDASDPFINGCHENAHYDGDCLTGLQECVDACNAAPELEGGNVWGTGSSGGSDTGTT
jgi:hypothetical protein